MYKINNRASYFHPQVSWETISSIIPSNYIRKGSLQVFYKIRRNYPEDHILCIGYDRGETQLAITETFKTYETSVDQVVDRCMNEELSMERIVRDSSIDMLSFIYHEKYATIYCVPFRVTHDNVQATSNPLSVESEQDVNQDDDKKRKLVLFLHGPKEVLLNLFSRFYSVEREISHLTAIPVSKISNVFPKFFPPSPYPAPIKKPLSSSSSSPISWLRDYRLAI